MNIISIDPAGNGATGWVEGRVEQGRLTRLTNFGVLDYRFDNIQSAEGKRIRRHKLNKNFAEYIIGLNPDLIIIENFIQYKVQMGQYGQSFPTAEMIGVLEYLFREKNIPVIRRRASVLRIPGPTQYYEKPQFNDDGTPILDEDGVQIIKKYPKPRKFKEYLTTKALKEQNLLKAGRHNKTHIVINNTEMYALSDYQVGAKNDHVVMAIKHLVDCARNLNLYDTIDKINKEKVKEEEEHD